MRCSALNTNRVTEKNHTHRCNLWNFNGMDLEICFCSFAFSPPLSFLWHTLDTEECSYNTGRPQCYTAKFGTKWNKWQNLSGSAAHKESVDEITYIPQLRRMEKSVKLEFFINLFSKKHFLVCVLKVLLDLGTFRPLQRWRMWAGSDSGWILTGRQSQNTHDWVGKN